MVRLATSADQSAGAEEVEDAMNKMEAGREQAHLIILYHMQGLEGLVFQVMAGIVIQH